MSEWQFGIYEVEWQGKVGIEVGRLDVGLFLRCVREPFVYLRLGFSSLKWE